MKRGSKLFQMNEILFEAVSTDDHCTVRELLCSGLSFLYKMHYINVRNGEGDTLLTLAARKGNSDIAEILISSKAKLNKRDLSGNTPLHIAIENSDLVLAELLVSKGASVNISTSDARSPLWLAVTSNQTKMIKLLRDNGAL